MKQEERKIVPHSTVLNALLDEIQRIDFKEKAEVKDERDLTRLHFVVASVEEILRIARSKHWSLCVSDGIVYVFNGASWRELTKAELQKFLGKAAEKLGVEKSLARYHAFRDELVKQFISAAHLPKPETDNNAILINLSNGTFEITPHKQYLRPFDQDDFLTYQLPFALNEAAQAPLFEKYLNRVLPDPIQQRILAELIGAVFIRRQTLKLEKAGILLGEGSNGKSVFFDIVNALLGPENVSSYRLSSLTNESGYQRAKLKGKLLNYASEISVNMDTTLFKQLVSGEPVEARLPYGEPFTLRDYAKFLFNTNSLPKDVELNIAFFRRFIILHFAVTIPENEQDPELANKIIQSELPGVFNWVLTGLKRVLTQKKYSESKAVNEMLEQYKTQSDSVRQFVEDEGYVKDSKHEILLKSLFAEYNGFCTDGNYRPVSTRNFAERLRKIGFETWKKKSGIHVDAWKKEFLEASSDSPDTPSPKGEEGEGNEGV